MAQLPRIVRFIGTTDAPGSACPHCGATGRFILRFRVEDGRELGAMRGCVQLFPVSPIAREELRLRKKAEDYVKRGWHGLGPNDQRALNAIDDFYAGKIDERAAIAIVDGVKRANTARFRGRR